MCTGLELMAVTAMASSAAGTGMAAYGQHQAVKAQNYAAEFNEQVARNNAEIARWRGEAVERRGGEEARRARIRTQVLRGKQRAGYAGAGVRVGSGSPEHVEMSTALLGEMDALSLEYNASLEAWAMEQEARGFESQAELERSKRRSSFFPVAGTILGGVSQLGGQYGQFKMAKML